MEKDTKIIQKSVRVVPLRDIVISPSMTVSLFIGREKSIAAINEANQQKQKLLFVTQKSDVIDNPSGKDLYDVGTLSKILQLMKLPDETFKILVEGVSRAKIKSYYSKENCLWADYKVVSSRNNLTKVEKSALTKAIISSFKKLCDICGYISKEIFSSVTSEIDLNSLIDNISIHISASPQKKQTLLSKVGLKTRASYLIKLIMSEIEVLNLEKSIKDEVKTQVEKNQREYYLNEQMKAIYKELGDLDEIQEMDEFRERVLKSRMSTEATAKALNEIKKLKMMSPSSAESTVSRNYIETLLSLPWLCKKVEQNIVRSKSILDNDHYGLDKVKERIIEYLSVQQRTQKINGLILCLVGNPGVGKTSLGQSIAKATGRKYIRMALGGVKDESEIRGHRRTYIGALPGQIIQKISKIRVKNPLFLLDEIDKMSSDFRGDPTSAMLEVLDPEQNKAFNDHYLEIDYDLSNVMFVATANNIFDIPYALRDRMEIIKISGYTESEKVCIAKNYLVPKSIKDHGLTTEEIFFDLKGLTYIVQYYTRESGVRLLKQEIDKICRKVLKEILLSENKEQKTKQITINANNICCYLGPIRYELLHVQKVSKIGQVTGLAWTEVGGELLNIEVVIVPGKGRFKNTGTLGDVMQESIQTAMTLVRKKTQLLKISSDFHENHDFHVHVPDGSTPKDGPSAGIGMCIAIISAISRIPVSKDIAMTGEVTLVGEVLRIGGLKEKLLAALRGGVSTVFIPSSNKKDLSEFPLDIINNLEIIPIDDIDEIIQKLFLNKI